MYIAAFALLTAAGAWGAWHSNPTYSTKRTLRYLAATLVGVTVAIAAIASTVRLTEHSPVAVMFGAMAAVVIACTLCLIWLVVAVSLPASTVPTHTKLVTVHRRKLIPWVRRFAWLLLGCALLAVALPGDWKSVVYAVGGLAIFLGITLLFTAFLTATHFDRSLTSVERHPWVHWCYAPDEWKTWGDAEVARLASTPPPWNWRNDWKRFATSLAVLAAVVFAFNARTVPLLWNVGTVAVAGFTMFCFVALSEHYGKTAPYRLRRLLSSALPEAFFGDAGVYADGVYTEWLAVSDYLIAASIDEGVPRSLSLLFNRYVGGAGNPMSEVRRYVLIPIGADGDMAVLQANIAAACPSAQVAIATSV